MGCVPTGCPTKTRLRSPQSTARQLAAILEEPLGIAGIGRCASSRFFFSGRGGGGAPGLSDFFFYPFQPRLRSVPAQPTGVPQGPLEL